MYRLPICGWISTTNSSPSCSSSCGLCANPTPAGVPVMITVPLGSVVPWERKLTICSTEKMRSLAEHCQSTLETRTKGRRDIRQPAILDHLPILQAPQPQLTHIRHQPLVDQHWTDWAGTVEALGVTPLRLRKLRRSALDVIAGRVSQDVVERVRLRDVLGFLAQHDGQFRLVICRVASNRVLGNDGWGWVGVGEAGCRFAGGRKSKLVSENAERVSSNLWALFERTGRRWGSLECSSWLLRHASCTVGNHNISGMTFPDFDVC